MAAATDTYTTFAEEDEEQGYVAYIQQWTFTRRCIRFAVEQVDADGETTVTVETRTADNDVAVDRFHGYLGDASGMGFCPVQSARAFVAAMIDAHDPNRPSLEERLALELERERSMS
jgi:hypothetical protein